MMNAKDLERLARIRALVALEEHGVSEIPVTIDDLKWLLDQLGERWESERDAERAREYWRLGLKQDGGTDGE